MKKLLLWIVVLMLVATFSLVGCKTAPEAVEAEEVEEEAAVVEETPVVEEEKAKIVIWGDTVDGDTALTGWEEDIIPQFLEQNKNIEIEYTQQPNVHETTRTALLGGAGPDIVISYGPSFASELAKGGYLYPLDDFVKEYGWDNVFAPWSLTSYIVEGSLYALPDEIETLVLYYNKTLFDEKGWKPPTTIDELLVLCKDIAEEGIIPFAHCNAEWRPANEWFVGEFLNHAGGTQVVYEALIGQGSWTDPSLVYSMEILNEIVQKGWFTGGLDRYYTTTFDEQLAMFGDGKAAMNIEGTWSICDYPNYFGEEAGNSNDWDWVPMPSVTGEAIFDVGIGSVWGINKNTEYPEATAKFIDYFYSSEVQGRLLSGVMGKAPAPVELEEKDLKGVDPRYAEILLSLSKAFEANNYGYTTWTFLGPKSNLYLVEEIEKVWAGDITVEQYLEGMQEIFSEELEAGEGLPIPVR